MTPRRNRYQNILSMLVVLVTVIILSLMYKDLQVGLTIFQRPSLAQTTTDDLMRKLHIAPVLGGHDLSAPYTFASPNAKIILEPTMGSHRYNTEAVFAIGNTLDFEETVLFVTTLRQSGFEGDIVLSTVDKSVMSKELLEFLEYHSQKVGGLVVYDGVIRLHDSDDSFSKDKNVITDYVYLRGLYGDKTNLDINMLEDSRIPRSLGVARFELYWVWSTKYSPSSRILLIDAEDTYFQPNGEMGIGTHRACATTANETTPSILHIYEENQKMKKHRLDKIENKTMLIEAYKKDVIMDFACNENVLTPASTHGDQRAIEAYLRAMVKQFDYTQCAKYWCEWAFHNYVFYLGVLWSNPNIDEVKVYMQGTGAINSIGQDIPLETSNIFDNVTYTVNNLPMGNGIHPSWAVHQYKSDEQLYQHINETKKRLVSELNYSKNILNHDIGELPNDTLRNAKPILGNHRENVDAIFSIISASDVKKLAFFVLSARKSGFDGDIVLSIPKLSTLSPEVVQFLESQANGRGIVVYEVIFKEQKGTWLIEGFYSKGNSEARNNDPRPPRSKHLINMEIYSSWADNYADSSALLLINGEEAYFQRNPFSALTCELFTLHLFQDQTEYRMLDKVDLPVARALSSMFTSEELTRLRGYPLINPHAVLGHRPIVKRLLMGMLNTIQYYQCYEYGCDWASLNYVWYKEGLTESSSISYLLKSYKVGLGEIQFIKKSLNSLHELGLYSKERKEFLNWDKSVTPVLLNYPHNELGRHFETILKDLLWSESQKI